MTVNCTKILFSIRGTVHWHTLFFSDVICTIEASRNPPLFNEPPFTWTPTTELKWVKNPVLFLLSSWPLVCLYFFPLISKINYAVLFLSEDPESNEDCATIAAIYRYHALELEIRTSIRSVHICHERTDRVITFCYYYLYAWKMESTVLWLTHFVSFTIYTFRNTDFLWHKSDKMLMA